MSLVSHVGIAVNDLDASVSRYTLLLGCKPAFIEDVPDQKVRVAVFETPESVGGRVELLTPTSPDSSISRFLEKRGEGLHHICTYVEDLETTLTEMKQEGVKLIDETPRIGAGGCRIAFVHPSSTGGVLIELEERQR